MNMQITEIKSKPIKHAVTLLLTLNVSANVILHVFLLQI